MIQSAAEKAGSDARQELFSNVLLVRSDLAPRALFIA